MRLSAIDGDEIRRQFELAGRNPAWLWRLLRRYPSGLWVKWVQSEIARLFSLRQFDEIEALLPNRGERREDAGLRAVLLDFRIFQEVSRLVQSGIPLTANASGPGAFEIVAGLAIMGRYLSAGQVRRRYYRFIKHQPARIIDGKRLIVGPARVTVGEVELVGFWICDPDD